jgi:hypothetical protein
MKNIKLHQRVLFSVSITHPNLLFVCDVILLTSYLILNYDTPESAKMRHFHIEKSKIFWGEGAARPSVEREYLPVSTSLGAFGASILVPSVLGIQS